MSLLAEHPPVPLRRPVEPVWVAGARDGYVLLVLVVATIVLPDLAGGHNTGAVAPVLLVTASGVVVSRAWRVLPAWLLVLAAVLATAPLALLWITGVGRQGAVGASVYPLAATVLVTVLAWARTPGRREAVAATLCAGGAVQFALALTPWWGGGDPSRPIIGTYYWHNQFAAALIAPAIIGLALVVADRPMSRTVGWICTPFCVAGVVLSSSRASMAMLALALAVHRGPARRRPRPPASRARACGRPRSRRPGG